MRLGVNNWNRSKLIHSGMKQVIGFMNFIQSIHSKILIRSETKQVIDFMNESLNNSLKRLVQKLHVFKLFIQIHWFIMKQTLEFVWKQKH